MDRDRTPRNDERNTRPDDRNSRTDHASPAPERDRNTPGQDRDRKPSDATGPGRTGAGDIFNRTRPGGDSARRDRDYRGDAYNGGTRRDGNNREIDRYSNLVGTIPRPIRDRGRDIFSRSREGRQYNNGISLRSGGYISDRHLRNYFPREYCYYPYYYPRYDPGLVFLSRRIATTMAMCSVHLSAARWLLSAGLRLDRCTSLRGS